MTIPNVLSSVCLKSLGFIEYSQSICIENIDVLTRVSTSSYRVFYNVIVVFFSCFLDYTFKSELRNRMLFINVSDK